VIVVPHPDFPYVPGKHSMPTWMPQTDTRRRPAWKPCLCSVLTNHPAHGKTGSDVGPRCCSSVAPMAQGALAFRTAVHGPGASARWREHSPNSRVLEAACAGSFGCQFAPTPLRLPGICTQYWCEGVNVAGCLCTVAWKSNFRAVRSEQSLTCIASCPVTPFRFVSEGAATTQSNREDWSRGAE
jgi:hypothetical protein